MSRDTVIAIFGGCLSAAASLVILTGAPGGLIFVYLAPLPLLLAGLGLGLQPAIVAGAAGALVSAMIGGPGAAGVYLVVSAVPVCIAVRQALLNREGPGGKTLWHPPGAILALLTVFSGAMLVMAAIYFGADGGMEPVVAHNLGNAFSAMWPQVSGEDRSRIIALLAPWLPGAIGMVWVLVSILNGILAQGLLVRMKRNLRPTPSYSELDLPDWISWFLVGAAALALAGSGQLEYLGRNLVMVFALPFFLLGLAVAHTLARRTPMAGMILAGLYVMLIMSGGAILAVAGIGLVEQWIGLRRRFAAPDKNQEDG